MRRLSAVVLFLNLASSVAASTKLLVTVVDQKSGQPVTDLKAEDFTILDDKTEATAAGGLRYRTHPCTPE